jgi:hypothetical protein
MRQLRRDKILRDVLGLGQGKRGLARLGLVSLETVLAQLIEEPDLSTSRTSLQAYVDFKFHISKSRELWEPVTCNVV